MEVRVCPHGPGAVVANHPQQQLSSFLFLHRLRRQKVIIKDLLFVTLAVFGKDMTHTLLEARISN